ncbi:hypothetical protein TURU_120348 [Turdus rufiventris]|nr:hypothetical protein TURU_120348 [Turdus rufiventris]
MDGKAAPNGVATIEDRILRITGYYGYYPGYSSQKTEHFKVIVEIGCKCEATKALLKLGKIMDRHPNSFCQRLGSEVVSAYCSQMVTLLDGEYGKQRLSQCILSQNTKSLNQKPKILQDDAVFVGGMLMDAQEVLAFS